MLKTEAALSAAVRALLRKSHIGKILVKDICKEANVSKAVFYAYFSDKDDLLKYCQRH